MDLDTTRRFKALANKNRLAIFEYLRRHGTICGGAEGCCTVGSVAEQFELALSTVSHHLKVLLDAGLIDCEQHGQFSFCSINPQALEEMKTFFSATE